MAKRFHKKAKRTGQETDVEIFRTARRAAKSAYRTARAKFYSDISQKLLDPTTGCKTFWKLTKLVYGNKVSEGIPDILFNNTLIKDTAGKAAIFNKYFTRQSSLPPGSDNDPLPAFHAKTDSILDKIETSPEEVHKILRSLNVAKAAGPDGVSNRILRECADSLCIPLARLFNFSLTSGVFPSPWKYANVVPVFKKSDRQRVENYRPVSLLPTLSKVLERIVNSSLYSFCMENKL